MTEETKSVALASPAIRRRRERLRGWLLNGTKASTLVMIAAVCASIPKGVGPDFAGKAKVFASWSLFALAVFALLALVTKVALPFAGDLSVDREKNLRVRYAMGGESTFTKDEVSEGITVPLTKGGVRTELRLRNGDVLDANLASAQESEQLLDALGLDVERRSASIDTGSTGHRIGLGCSFSVGLFLVTVGAMSWLAPSFSGDRESIAALGLILVCVGGAALAQLISGAQVTVGTDGVRVERGPWRRFVSYEHLSTVRREGNGIQLLVDDGSKVFVLVVGPDVCDALIERITLARMASKGHGAALAWVEALDRNGRPFEVWRAALQKLAQAGPSYRSSAPTREGLLQVLEDAKSSVERRLAAALALSKDSTPEVKERIRVAAESTALEPVRVALAHIAQDAEDETVARAVSEATTTAEP